MALFLRPSSTSSAVKIVSPSKSDDPKPVSKPSPSKKGPVLVLSLTRHVSVLTDSPPDQPQRQCRNILIYGLVSPSLRPCRLFKRALGPASSRTRGVSIITLRYVSESYHITNSSLTGRATDSKNLWNLCKFTHTLRETRQHRVSKHSSPLHAQRIQT